MPMPAAGSIAPTSNLPATRGQRIDLSDDLGKVVVLHFYPGRPLMIRPRRVGVSSPGRS